ncbi:MAG TPA: hypothetical protein VNX29_16125 [Kaistia sp.]|nr:hypothetical protein [Kaistia sp.]
MQLFPSKSKSPTRALEADLADLVRRRDKLKGRLDRAVLDAERAASERRRLVLEVDEPDTAAVLKAEAACRAADEARATIEDALRHAAVKIAGIEQNIAELTDRAERAAAAEDLERRALFVDVSVGDFRDAVAVVAERYAGLIAAMRESGPIIGTHGMAIAPQLAALAVLDAAIRNFEPQLIPRMPMEGEPAAPTNALAVAQSIVSAPLRALAADIRAGKAAAASAEKPKPRRAPILFENVRIVAYQPLAYVSAEGSVATTFAGDLEVPGPVAEAVFSLGLGEPAGTASARIWLGQHQHQLGNDYGFTGQYADTGVNLWQLANGDA